MPMHLNGSSYNATYNVKNHMIGIKRMHSHFKVICYKRGKIDLCKNEENPTSLCKRKAIP